MMSVNFQRESDKSFFFDICNKAVASIFEYVKSHNSFTCDLDYSRKPEMMDEVFDKSKNISSVVYGGYTGLDLGCYPDYSLSYVIPVRGDFIREGMNCYTGKDYRETATVKKNASYLQILIASVDEENFSMERMLAKRSMTGLVNGYMARSRGNGTSVKIHSDLISAGYSREMTAYHLRRIYSQQSNDDSNQIVIIGIDCDEHIESMKTIIDPIEKFNESMKKYYIAKTIEDCTGSGDCSICDDIVVCNNIRLMNKHREK